MYTEIRVTPLDGCHGTGGWFEAQDILSAHRPDLLKVQINNMSWDYWKITVSFYLPHTEDPVNLFHFSTSHSLPYPWKAGLELGLRQGRLTAGLNHGLTPQENLSRYEEVRIGPTLDDGLRHEILVWNHGEWPGLQGEKGGGDPRPTGGYRRDNGIPSPIISWIRSSLGAGRTMGISSSPAALNPSSSKQGTVHLLRQVEWTPRAE